MEPHTLPRGRVLSYALLLASCALTACTTFNGLTADEGTEGPGALDTKTGADRGNGVTDEGKGCKGPDDCQSHVCAPDSTCHAPSPTDGVKNGTESDVDCGGGGTKCEAGKTCNEGADCFWGFCTGGVCEDHKPGRKDGDQTDVDCGGTRSPACDWDKGCLEARDCTSAVCGPDKKCLTGPSCNTVHGGTTCGTGEFGTPGKQHESCCRSLPVTGFTDARQAGKTVYLDKYEITAGRMRTFLAAIAADNGGQPNVRATIAKKRPARWDQGWEEALPTANFGSITSYAVANPTVNPLYPGQDRYQAMSTQSSWSVTSGNYQIDLGVFFALGAPHYFPEYSPSYAAEHNLNCTNTTGSYGFGTYWFDNATVASYSGGIGKAFTKDQMDEKALNCTPFALFAAFCAWDGGQLATDEVFDFVAGGPWGTSGSPVPPRLTGGNTQCGAPANTLNTFGDSGNPCPSVYYYPPNATSHDDSARIAPPGRIPADTVSIAGGEPWMDLKGNLVEAVLASNGLFTTRGYGAGWASAAHHRLQATTPRMKAGSYGARCMRFK